eukprot:TRINITY_DN9701_c0_g1_i2.p1 TRINITY_DN9701_c0_g1~~TRINITY_DN9701_c0_g1_i2.p1  ORF type:complete len:1137 (+),score=245.73 TRINITY_DN9701_c0_g1_i2:61-3471(+)
METKESSYSADTSGTYEEIDDDEIESFSEDEKSALETQVRRILSFNSPDGNKHLNESGHADTSLNRSNQFRSLLKVFLRIQEKKDKDHEGPTKGCLRLVGNSAVAMKAPVNPQFSKVRGDVEGRFMFTKVFMKEDPVENIFQETTLPLLETVFSGENALLLTCGMKNSDQPFTIQGSKDSPGIAQLLVSTVLMNVQVLSLEGPKTGPRAKNTDLHMTPTSQKESVPDCYMSVMYMEVRDDKISDLLVPVHDRREISLREVQSKVLLPGLRESFVSSWEEVESLFSVGSPSIMQDQNGGQDKTGRGHVIFVLNIYPSSPVASAAGHLEPTRITIVDLCETVDSRPLKTPDRMTKASVFGDDALHTLGRCLESIKHNQFTSNATKHLHVPFRESKLTRILQDYFTEPSSIAMVSGVNNDYREYEKITNILRFSALAKEIQTLPQSDSQTKKSLGVPYTPSEKRLMAENARLQYTNEELCQEIERLEALLIEAETKCQQIEADVRFEVSNEMAHRLREMEFMYRSRLDQENVLAEETYERKLRIFQKAALRQQSSGVKDESEIRSLYRDMKKSHQKLLDLHSEVLEEMKKKSDMLSLKQAEIDQLNRAIISGDAKRAELSAKLTREQQEVERLIRERDVILSQQKPRSVGDSPQRLLSHSQQEMATLKRIHAIELTRMSSRLDEQEKQQNQLRMEIANYQILMDNKDRLIRQLQLDLDEKMQRERDFNKIIKESEHSHVGLLESERKDKEKLRMEMEELRISLQEATSILKKIPASPQIFRDYIYGEAQSPTIRKIVEQLSPGADLSATNPNVSKILHPDTKTADDDSGFHTPLSDFLPPVPPANRVAVFGSGHKRSPSFRMKPGFQHLGLTLPSPDAKASDYITAKSQPSKQILARGGETLQSISKEMVDAYPSEAFAAVSDTRVQSQNFGHQESIGSGEKSMQDHDSQVVRFLSSGINKEAEKFDMSPERDAELSPRRKRKSPKQNTQTISSMPLQPEGQPDTPKRIKSDNVSSPSGHIHFENQIPDAQISTHDVVGDRQETLGELSHADFAPHIVLGPPSKEKPRTRFFDKSKKIAKSFMPRRNQQPSQAPIVEQDGQVETKQEDKTQEVSEASRSSSKKKLFSFKKKDSTHSEDH